MNVDHEPSFFQSSSANLSDGVGAADLEGNLHDDGCRGTVKKEPCEIVIGEVFTV